MKVTITHDYGEGGLTIQEAMVDHAKRFPNKNHRPDYILWGGRRIKTVDVFQVHMRGIVRGEFLSTKENVDQGFDIRIDDGWLELEQGERIPHLRTWRNCILDDIVEYPFHSYDGRLWVWNIYKMEYSGGSIMEEYWTGNAGFWIEYISETERIYHCSHGMNSPPNFDSLVFKVVVR